MLRWYVMQSKPKKEAFLRERLGIQRIEVYLPLLRIKPVNPRARKERPFFPGYLFFRVNLDEFSISELRGIPGSIRIVSYGGEPAHVADALIRAMQEQVDQINDSVHGRVDRFKSGDLVVIGDGPFATYKAMFDRRLTGQDRVQVLLEMLEGQQIRLELSGRQLHALTQ